MNARLAKTQPRPAGLTVAAVVDQEQTAHPHRWVRNTVIGVLVAEVLALSVTGVVVGHRPDLAPVRGTVVESRCIDGRVNESIDDGNPDGLLAYDTGVSC